MQWSQFWLPYDHLPAAKTRHAHPIPGLAWQRWLLTRHEEYSSCPCSYDRVLQCCASRSTQPWGKNSSKRTTGLLGSHFGGSFNLSQQTAVMPAGETASRSWGNWLCRTGDTWQCQEEHTALRGVGPEVSATGSQNLLHKLSVYTPNWSISNL